MGLQEEITARGGIVDSAWLRAHGVPRSTLDAALRGGELRRLRRGWFATPGAHPDLTRAVRAGGVVTCVSALGMHGVWVPREPRLHLRAARGDDVTRSSDLRLHWTDRRCEGALLDGPEDAWEVAAGCLDLRDAVAVTDSVVNAGILPLDLVVAALERTARGRRVLERMDPRAESGLETYARLALRSRGIRMRSQVVVPGVGRVDLLIGRRLVLELDGAAWHTGIDAVERDRRRDRELVARGYLVMRVTTRQLRDQWPEVEGQILRIIGRREHRRPAADA